MRFMTVYGVLRDGGKTDHIGNGNYSSDVDMIGPERQEFVKIMEQ